MSAKVIVNFVLWVSLFAFSVSAFGQTTSFVYQGKLSDGAGPANGAYQFEFKLYNAAGGGAQVGGTLSSVTANVVDGIFAVTLDFGAASFDGDDRFLEIGVRLSESGQPYTTLNPRQPITSTPYAIKSLTADSASSATTATTATNSLSLGGVPAGQFVVTTDARMTDSRTPTAGSPSYIQNATNLQATSNFNISGEGKANGFDAKGYKISGVRFFHTTGTDNAFVGANSGNSIAAGGNFNSFLGSESGKLNTSGSNNSFVGYRAGMVNTSGKDNSFFGSLAGKDNHDGNENSFFGVNAGTKNTVGSGNAFFGRNAGFGNLTGSNNSFFGSATGQSNTSGVSNAFFGGGAGLLNSTGGFNVFVGRNAGLSNGTGANNTAVGFAAGNTHSSGTDNVFIGANAGSVGNLSNSIAIGSGVKVASSNTAMIGNANHNVKMPGSVEIGKSLITGGSLEVAKGDVTIADGDINLPLGSITASSADFKFTVSAKTAQISQGNITSLLTTGAIMNGLTRIQKLKLLDDAAGGADSDFLCITEDDDMLKRCFGFRPTKENSSDFQDGSSLISNLRPVTINSDGKSGPSLGLTFKKSDPANALVANRKTSVDVATVNYRQLIPAMVSAAQQQQERIDKQQSEIEALKAMICQSNSTAAVCQQK